MDEIDRADAEVERSLQEALRKRQPAGPAPAGHCLYCEEPLRQFMRWCSIECRDAWQKEVQRGRV